MAAAGIRRLIPFLEDQLHQQHIAGGAAQDADQRVPLPRIGGDGHGRGDPLGQEAAEAYQPHVLEAVDHQTP